MTLVTTMIFKENTKSKLTPRLTLDSKHDASYNPNIQSKYYIEANTELEFKP